MCSINKDQKLTAREEEEKECGCGREQQAKPAEAEFVVSEEKEQAAVPEEEITAKTEELTAKIADQQKKHDELQSSYRRLQADFDNFRKRARREKEETMRLAAEGLVGELLPVLDNFQRALAAPDAGDTFRSGVEMIYRQLQQVLEKQGLQKIAALGEEFNPNLHQAVMNLETDEHPHNTVVMELQQGYALNGKVLRPAMVQVADNPGAKKNEDNKNGEQ